MSAIVADFLTICVPSMERMVLVMERAKMAPKEARAGLEAAIASIEAQVLPALAEHLDQQDMFLDQVVREATSAAIAAAAAGSRAQRGTVPAPVFPLPPSKVQAHAETNGIPPAGAVPDPRPVTRGSGSGKTLPSVPAKGGRHGSL